MKEKIAIIGGGIAGLMAAYLLDRKHDITLFEKDSRLGGNAYTLNTRDNHTFDISVFAFSKSSYTNFFKLLSELNVEDTSFAVRGLGTCYRNLDTKETNVFSPLMLNPRWAIPSIRAGFKLRKAIIEGVRLLDEGKMDGLTTAEGLKLIANLEEKTYFRMVCIICLAASMYFDEVLKSPAAFYFGKLKKFFTNANFRLVKNKTKTYVDAMVDAIGGNIVLNSTVKSVARSENEVTIKTEDGQSQKFDKIVFACNADQVLDMVENPTDEEKRLLGIWNYKDGLVVVHQDYSSFPRRSLHRMYDYLYTHRDGKYHTSINASYWYQKGVSKKCRHLGSQHPNFPIDEKLVEFKKVFRTPIFETESFAMVDELPSLNGKMNSYFCGSHFGFGLHEDAVKSAVEVAEQLGVQWN
ncbi:MAG: FAD-dependent oxidoreductase [Proteobacteria bacterium]|nr:FAD-dependent oxidoreductase [Pseudomonadota bacterium]